MTPAPDTIVAISTPPGRGGIGVVRLSGPAARDAIAPLLALTAPLEPARARFTRLLDPTAPAPDGTPAVLDEAVVTWFAAPHSYTGEDVVELSTHGAPVILEHIVRLALVGGARLARPGEFTERAFLSGRLDLTAAEAVHDLVRSSTLHQARTAAAQLGGALSRALAPAKTGLLHLIAALEAGIDFAEDDLDLLPDNAIAARLAAVAAPLAALQATFGYGQILRQGTALAVVGRPNAGKSSLFNALLARNRAIVAATPGTTRDLITETLDLDGIPVELTDTAGLRDSTDEIEQLGIARSREALADAAVILLVLDSTAPYPAGDQALLQQLAGRPVVIALNKIDLPAARTVIAAGPERPPPAPIAIPTSAVTGEGLPALRTALRATLASAPDAAAGGALLTNLRQHVSVTAALAALSTATDALHHRVPHEMLLLDLRQALDALDDLTGATTPDDILHLIFSTFCIGK